MWLHAIAVFLSALLLFEIQPVVGKWILPSFGGTAGVWSACMLFFQLVLLLGYVYSDWSVRRLSPKRQVSLHLLLLAASAVAVALRPVSVPYGAALTPVLLILWVLAITIGLPYFVLSTTTPLIQAWYARTHGAALPYRLFAVSNFASMLALLAYPLVIEPNLPVRGQFRVWSAAYGVFIVLCGIAAMRARRGGGAPAEARQAASGAAPRGHEKAMWVALTACASMLLLAVTNHITQDVAPMPFLWVVPLVLYLLSFVICFADERIARQNWWRHLIGPALVGLVIVVYRHNVGGLAPTVAALSCALFVCCMFCHSEVARSKPAPAHLTSFYLMISIGGAAGGLFVGLIAPLAFAGFYELPVAMAVCAILAFGAHRAYPAPKLMRLSAVAVIGFVVSLQVLAYTSGTRLMARNFYGSLRVVDVDPADRDTGVRVLFHGNILHGAQFLNHEYRAQPTAYFGPASGIGLAIEKTRKPGMRVGIIGLGAGTLASYGRKGDYFRIYEINPLVAEVAAREFSFLRDAGAAVDIVIGDGRLQLERETGQKFDLLIVDAFSGGSIPVHLLTREAFGLYFRRLERAGMLAVHVSNQYLDVGAVVERLAAEYGRPAVPMDSGGDVHSRTLPARWILVPCGDSKFPPSAKAASASPPPQRGRVWTDDYSGLFGILK